MDLVSVSGHSFEALVLSLRAEMIGFAARMAHGNVHLAEDIVQDAYVRAMRAWARWSPDVTSEPGRDARSWMYRIVANVFVNTYHQERRLRRAAVDKYADIVDCLYNGCVVPARFHDPALSTVFAPRVSHPAVYRDTIIVRADDLGDLLDNQKYQQRVIDAIGRLPKQRREVLMLRYVDGLTQEETAARLGLPVGTIRSRTNRGLARLKPLLETLARERAGEESSRPGVDVVVQPSQMVKAHAGGVKGVMRRRRGEDRALVDIQRSPDELATG